MQHKEMGFIMWYKDISFLEIIMLYETKYLNKQMATFYINISI